MIAQERRGQAEGEPTAIASLLKEPGPGLFDVGGVRVTRKMLWKIGAGVVLVVLLNVGMFEGVEANRCFAILVFCTVLWASEVSGFFFLFCVVLKVVFRLYHCSSRQCSCLCFSSSYKSSEMTKASDYPHPMLQSTLPLT
jgi:phosphate transporter